MSAPRDAASAPLAAATTDWVRAMSAALERLPDLQRIVVEHVYVDGYGFGETARRMALSSAHVCHLLARALSDIGHDLMSYAEHSTTSAGETGP